MARLPLRPKPKPLRCRVKQGPDHQKRARDTMSSRRRCDLTVSQIAFFHDLELIRIVPVSRARNIPGCQDLDLGCEL